jgi:hypothetical protein
MRTIPYLKGEACIPVPTERCRSCGCTETNACPEGCSWAKRNYCTACAEKHLDALIEIVSGWFGEGFIPPTSTKIKGFDCGIEHRGDGAIAIRDHIGVPVFMMSARGDYYIADHYDADEIAEGLK